MTSNPHTHSKFPNNFRPTFGINDPHGKIYKDIIKSFLTTQILTKEELLTGFIVKDRKSYLIHCDLPTYRQIEDHNLAEVIISFQTRKTGRFALCRLLETKDQ